MNRAVFIIISIVALGLLLAAGGCDKEKITSSTEYVHDVEYVQLPPDTIYSTDTIYHHDSTSTTDTVFVTDTVFDTDSDTVIVHDTVINTVTVTVHDTVVTIQNHYDTVFTTVTVHDTVRVTSYAPNAFLAYTALEDYTDEQVIEFIYEQFGYEDGWVFYLSAHQSDIAQVSSSTYDIYGYIDYWTPEFDGYYALEYYWRLTYTGGDPANTANWTQTEVPGSAAALSGHQPGIRIVPKAETREAIR